MKEIVVKRDHPSGLVGSILNQYSKRWGYEMLHLWMVLCILKQHIDGWIPKNDRAHITSTRSPRRKSDCFDCCT